MKTYIALAAACAFVLTLAPAGRAIAAYGPAGASRAAAAEDQAVGQKQAQPRVMIAKKKGYGRQKAMGQPK